MEILKRVKAFVTSDWAQVVQIVVAVTSVVATMSGKMIDSAKVAETVGQIGVSAVGIIWLIETILNTIVKDSIKDK